MRSKMRSFVSGFAVAASIAAASMPMSAVADPAPDVGNWQSVLEQARGQTVYWHAWGGEPRINDYIAWAGGQVFERYGVEVVQVKLTDTADAVTKVLSEKTAGVDDGGAVDLIWINGENFAAMKRNDLLFGPWVEETPNFDYVDVAGKPIGGWHRSVFITIRQSLIACLNQHRHYLNGWQNIPDGLPTHNRQTIWAQPSSNRF